MEEDRSLSKHYLNMKLRLNIDGVLTIIKGGGGSMKAKGTLTVTKAQGLQLKRLTIILDRVYLFIRERCADGTIIDLRDIDYYFQKILTAEELEIPHALLLNVAKRAWGHAQINNKVLPFSGLCIPLEFIDFRLNNGIFTLDVLEDYIGLESIRFRCSATKFEGVKKHWIVMRKFDYGYTLTPEVRREVPRVNRHIKWAWGALEIDNEIQGAYLTWVKVQNSFVAYFRSQYSPDDIPTEAQVYGTYKVWYNKLGKKSVRIADAFPLEVYTYLLYDVYRKMKKGKYPHFVPRSFDTFSMLIMESSTKNPWQWLYCPLFGHVKYFANADTNRYMAETVNTPHVMRIKMTTFRDGKERFLVGVKPFEGNLVLTESQTILME